MEKKFVNYYYLYRVDDKGMIEYYADEYSKKPLTFKSRKEAINKIPRYSEWSVQKTTTWVEYKESDSE